MIEKKEIAKAISYYSKEIAVKKSNNTFDEDSVYCLGILTGLMISIGKETEFINSFENHKDGWLGYVIDYLKDTFDIII